MKRNKRGRFKEVFLDKFDKSIIKISKAFKGHVFVKKALIKKIYRVRGSNPVISKLLYRTFVYCQLY